MKKNKVLIFTRILIILFAIGTVILLCAAYIDVDIDIDNRIIFKLGIAYVLLAFFLLLYIPFITILNLRKLKWIEIRKRLIKCIALFAQFAILNYVLDYIFRPSKIDLFRVCTNALSLAFGLTFIDVIFFKKKEN